MALQVNISGDVMKFAKASETTMSKAHDLGMQDTSRGANLVANSVGTGQNTGGPVQSV